MDFQWISEKPNTLIFNLARASHFIMYSRKKNIWSIENNFYEYFGKPVVLMPSGRSAIHYYARLEGFSRDDSVFITKYSSFCMYQSLGTIMNVSTDYVAPDLLVVNHKWGYPNLDPRAGMHDFILEDSCDSLFNNDSNLFLNDGIVTIISLSKVIGTLSGALVIFNQSSELEKKFRLLQNQNSILGKLQFLKKVFRILLPNVFKLPLQDEHANTFLTNIELAMIRKKLHKYRENYNLNESRIKKLNNIFGREFENRHRIGPGVVLKISNSTEFDENKVLPIGIIRRNFNFSNSNDAEGVYQKCIYVPIHGNISDVLFIEYLDFLAKHRDCLELS